MTAAELEKQVLKFVQDASFSGGVLPFLNQGINWIAGHKKLAALECADTVQCTVDSDNVALPSNYMHGVYFVGDGTRRIGSPQFYDQFGRFVRYNPDLTKTGSIHDVAVKGNNLYYANREDKTLTIRFFEKPTLLSKPGSVPVCIPDHLHEELLVNFAAWKIYDLIEDGIDDPKTNTGYYQNLFFSFLPDIDLFCVNTDEPEYVQDEAERIFW